jgi:hypothetical protein
LGDDGSARADSSSMRWRSAARDGLSGVIAPSEPATTSSIIGFAMGKCTQLA